MTTYTFTSNLARQSSGVATSSGQKTRLETTTKYRVHFDTSPAPPDECAYTIDLLANEAIAICSNDRATQAPTADQVPTPQLDILFSNGKVAPFMHCVALNAEQNRKATQEWLMTASFSTPDLSETTIPELAPITPPSTESGYPVIYQDELRIVDRVLYEDESTPPQRCELPTGNLFTQPFIQKYACETVVVTQYEQAFTEALAAERLQAVNSTTWNGGNASKWKITDIKWQPVRLVIASGNADSYLVQYRVEKLDKDGGWRSRRALLDTHYLTTANDQSTRQPFVTSEGGRTNYIGMTKLDGTASASTIEYKEYLVQPEIDFSFLRAASP